MRIILHIGTHKTASTTIQTWLASSEAHLASHQVAALPYPPFSRSKEIMEADHVDPTLVADCQAELETGISRLSLSPDHTLIISYEGFSGSIRRAYSNATVCARILAQVLERHSTTVAIYLRPQDSFIESIYTQRIHQGESLSFPEFLASLPPLPFDWQAHTQAFAEAFGTSCLRVRPYHKSQLPEPDSILRDICQIIDCPFEPSKIRSPNQNTGYSRDALELALLVNPALSASDQSTLRELLRKTAAKGTWNAYSYLTLEQRSTIQRACADTNEQVAQKFLGGPWASFFPADSDAPPYPGLTPVGASAIFIKLLLELRQQYRNQYQLVKDDHQAQMDKLKLQLNKIKRQLEHQKQRTQSLVLQHQNLSLLGKSKLLRRLSKWEQTLSRLWNRKP
jgi:hypothetical protein